MSTKIFVNLPVQDLQRSIDFWTRLGFSFNAQFTDDKATSMIVGNDIYVMLLVEERFRDFTTKDIVDAAAQTEAIIALSAESREGVDELVDKALRAGGKPSMDPMDEGFMYGRSFQDPDGHLWEVVWIDLSSIDPQ